MTATKTLHVRQIWGLDTFTRVDPQCTAITLPSDGVLSFAPDNIVTLTENVVFQPLCTSRSNNTVAAPIDPFYASSTPQVYVVAAATVLAWVLVIMLVISPRTFLSTVSAGPAPLSGGKGIIGGANGGYTSAIGIGSRPWLQKAAALTVAISLTIATADTFNVSAEHYPGGIDGNSMRAKVEGSLEIKISRLISDIFVWLAQVQSLIRLFPRHKEKVLIKWIGFVLIILDTTFSAVNSFLPTGKGYRRPRDFVDAIPALTYLFELALSLLYAAWVIYYAFTKRRYAFYHPVMKSNALIALLSMVAVLTPVVFFVTDITLSNIASWGDYFRWVGAAAASVVVWEWVERIELLERYEKKDGILGREIFDGDEMLDSHPTGEMTYNAQRNDSYVPRRRSFDRGSTNSGTGNGGGAFSRFNHTISSRFGRSRRTTPNLPIKLVDSRSHLSANSKELALYSSQEDNLSSLSGARSITRPLPTATPPPNIAYPPSRTDTASAASTIYVVRHDGTADIQPVRHRFATPDRPESRALDTPIEEATEDASEPSHQDRSKEWYSVANPFKRKRAAPPAEVSAAIKATGDAAPNSSRSNSSPGISEMRPIRTIRHKFGGLKSRAQNRNTDRTRSDIELPWTVIPAQPRGTTWSPSNAGSSSALSSSAGVASRSNLGSSAAGAVERGGRPADERGEGS
ncbi:PalH-domain-containing protein [Myriangium duriaei CBS 260.36]|uniref:PalH-domain-containing protein n=1 Tax=Myriangium duriaei CBS 260.36 TaxID=1168546 RepID=A0A9P4JB70_9PEZI|nr:PalH-domain-containing protein [Myriangium duriaei CBS 260.36]